MYTPDLSTSCDLGGGPAVRAIGWLEKGMPFPTGQTDPQFRDALRAHAADPGRWLPVVACGVHFCDLGTCSGIGGAQNVIIPSTSCLYIAPELIVHYVEEHAYAPPAEFVEAVLACPEQSSEAYVALLAPLASTWGMDAATVREIAASAPEWRQRHAEAVARELANRGNFKW